MERLFAYWAFRLRPWMRWAVRVLVYLIAVAILGSIAAGVVATWVRIIMHDN